ncbi:nitrogen fixation protein FixH [Gemmobacter aquarius]|uniref:Nitrogen fixation protein FixH n=1 Tax=Paragemmobacter aquarius TaxID=2169400 RepID=A0A2S0UP50_9RHOB|nr:FixH family protein [Gemmobacter aquarius]AWB49572.1 nitrogen fixation protein FixH [Gemmobacter aquarius]
MGELTGKHVLGITVGAFSIIIGVNVVMAVKAVSTFPGLEVDNGYVASQSFDADRKAQEALGWKLTHGYANGRLGIDIRKGAEAAPVTTLDVLLGRTTEASEDTNPVFVRQNGVWVSDVQLNPGKWMMMIKAKAPDGTVFRQRLDLFVGK